LCCLKIFVLNIDSRTGDDPDKLAGELGFEPRSSVLETDSLTVELTPPVTVVGSQLSVLSEKLTTEN
jgi:hypothetical protein